MSGRYVEISLDEMREFLQNEGFIIHKRDDKTEYIANKIFNYNNDNYLIRVYTSINPNDKSRGIGSDAIRVCVISSDGDWIFGTKRVNRTKNWKDSVLDRISVIEGKFKE